LRIYYSGGELGPRVEHSYSKGRKVGYRRDLEGGVLGETGGCGTSWTGKEVKYCLQILNNSPEEKKKQDATLR